MTRVVDTPTRLSEVIWLFVELHAAWIFMLLLRKEKSNLKKKLDVTVRRCQQHKAPQYLIDCVTPASDIASRQRLRSASRHQLLVPRYRFSSLGRRSFAVAGPTTWNSLSADLRDPTCSDESFRRSLKTFLFAKHWCVHSLEVFLRRCTI